MPWPRWSKSAVARHFLIVSNGVYFANCYGLELILSEPPAFLVKAYETGLKAHDGQKRKSGEPYFTHPVAVATYLVSIGADADTVMAALLHDTVEDTNLTLDDVKREFGMTVARMVDGVTKLMENEIDTLPTLDQKIETLRKMFNLMNEDVRIMIIKLADRLHNMQTLSYRKPESQRTVAKETLDIYAKIADRLCMRDLRDELEQLCYSVLEPEIHGAIMILSEKNRLLSQNEVEFMEQKIRESFPQTAADIVYEKKSWEKMRLQQKLQQGSIGHPSLINLSFRCDSIEDCYRMLGVVHSLWPRESRTFDDFINIPIINGYKGLHSTVILPDGVRVRCKFRTHEMEEYAHIGIASKCFQIEQKDGGMLSYLPWTQRISNISEETKNRSSEFWETLQSDILSESLILYGVGSRSVLIPKGATALDGVFYLYPSEAIHVTSIRVNGEHVPLSHTLENGVLLEVSTSQSSTITREWLYCVQTGLSISVIRAALSESEHGDLASVGRNLLQQALTAQGGGYVEEFNINLIQQSFLSLGYHSEREGYIAIAERHLEPTEVASHFLHIRQGQGKKATEQKEECRFTFSVSRDVESLRNLLSVYERYNVSMKDIRLKLSFGPVLRMSVNINLSPDEQESYRHELMISGAYDIAVKHQARTEFALMFIVIVFWALNPVWAKYYLTQGMPPLLLVSLRSVLFFGFSTILFLFWRYQRSNTYSPIPKITKIALLPAISTTVHSLLTYLSVSLLAPSVHLTVLRFNILLLPIIHLWRNKDINKKLQMIISGISTLILLAFFFAPGIPPMGMFFAILTLISYICYSLITEKTLQQQRIGLRYPHFLFHLSLISALTGLALSPLTIDLLPLWLPHLGSIAFYVLFCVFIPHTCFHIVLQRTKFRHVTSMSLLEVPLAMLMEFALLGLFLSYTTYTLITVVLLTALILPQMVSARSMSNILSFFGFNKHSHDGRAA